MLNHGEIHVDLLYYLYINKVRYVVVRYFVSHINCHWYQIQGLWNVQMVGGNAFSKGHLVLGMKRAKKLEYEDGIFAK